MKHDHVERIKTDISDHLISNHFYHSFSIQGSLSDSAFVCDMINENSGWTNSRSFPKYWMQL